jgi:hypothetical protein
MRPEMVTIAIREEEEEEGLWSTGVKCVYPSLFCRILGTRSR